MNDSALAILAHPDDAEFLCAGTLIRLREAGWSIHIATMTPGDCGSTQYPPADIARMRRQEGTEAAHLIGGAFHCLEELDLRVHYNDATVDKVVHLLCAIRPRIVFTHSPDDYHIDHEMTSKLVRTATFAAPVPNFLFGRWRNPPLEHIPHLYYCDALDGKDILGRTLIPSFLIDVTAQVELKEKMLAAHVSQRDWLLRHHGVDDFVNAMHKWSAIQGERAGVKAAEGFRQHLGHSYPQDNLLGELLGGLTPKAG